MNRVLLIAACLLSVAGVARAQTPSQWVSHAANPKAPLATAAAINLFETTKLDVAHGQATDLHVTGGAMSLMVLSGGSLTGGAIDSTTTINGVAASSLATQAQLQAAISTALSSVASLQTTALATVIPVSQKGVVGGVAALDSGGFIISSEYGQIVGAAIDATSTINGVPASSLATQTQIQSAITAALQGYAKNAPGGVAGLNASGVMPVTELPDLATATVNGQVLSAALANTSSSGSSSATATGAIVTTNTVMTAAQTYLVVRKGVNGSPTTITLPASPRFWTDYTVIDGQGDAATNNITVVVAGGGLINSKSSYLLYVHNEAGVFFNDGTTWNAK